MIRVAKTKTTRRKEVEYVSDQDNLDAGQRMLMADCPEASSVAAQQQQHFQHLSAFPHPPSFAGPHIQWFAEHQGYVVDLIHQQQEVLQHQLAEMQQQQQAFMQQQQQVINNIITSMKVQVQPCLDATLNSLGSDDAEEFASDPDGNRMSTAWHNRHLELRVDGKKVRSLGRTAESSRHGCEGGEEEDPEAEFRRPSEPVLIILQEATSDNLADQVTPLRNLPERPSDVTVDDKEQSCSISNTHSDLSEYDQHSPGKKTTPGTSQQQALAGPCDASGYVDDVIQYHMQKHQPSTTVLPLHSLSVIWLKTNEPSKCESVEFAGLIEVPLSLNANVNISHLEMLFRSAVIVQSEKNGSAAEDQVRRNMVEMVNSSTFQPRDANESPGGKFRQQIRSKLEFEPPPSPRRTTTLLGEPEKRKFCRNMLDAICAKVGYLMIRTVKPKAVRRGVDYYGLEEKLKTSDIPQELPRCIRSSVSGSATPSRFDMSKQPTWSLGRPPDRFGGTGLPVSIFPITSTTAPSQSVLLFSRCARVLVPIRSSTGRLLMRFDLYHLY